MPNKSKDSDKTLGQRQGDLFQQPAKDVPEKGGIGQTGQHNPDRPGNKGVEHPTPKK